MPVTITVNKLSLVHKRSDGISSADLPDVCKSPSAPVPHANYAFSSDLMGGTSTIGADGGNMCAKMGSRFFRSCGDEPGCGGGIASGVFMQAATWMTQSFDTKFEGKGVNRLTDKMFHNQSNTFNGAGELQKNVVTEGKDKKADCYECRKQLIEAGKNSDDPDVRKAAERLERQQKDYEHALLSDNVYQGNRDTPVDGWKNISNNEQALEKYGLTKEQLQNSRAQLYEPDPSVFGSDMNPTVAFEGTDPKSFRDWVNNGRQGAGWSSDYYDNARNIGSTLQGQNVDVTGHSLGGGLASGASQSGGLNGTTFNSAGLHGNTVPNPIPGGNVNAYRVDGEVLTTLQEGSLIGLQNERVMRGGGLRVGDEFGLRMPMSPLDALKRGAGQLLQPAMEIFKTGKAALGTLMPDGFGNKFSLPGSGGAMGKHDMSSVLTGMKQQMAADQATLEDALGQKCNC